jgi:CO/xanthine dehydrogenase Mo-binding subunit
MAACWYGIARTAVIDRAAAWAELDDGGSAKIVTGVTEIGEGILTVLAQIAAHEMGVKPEHVVIGDNDTARAPEASHAGASRQTYVIGAQVAEVEVDTITGEVQVLGIWAAHDVGRAVNPQGVEGQIEGGIVQALGQALMEDYKLADGRTTTSGFAKYILPTALDVPRVNSIIIEDLDPIGPLGVKGVGEPAMVPTIPAIMNAIYDAVGVRITDLPATPEKVLMAIRDKERRDAMRP